MKKILIIEDDKTISDELKILLDDNGYDSYQLFNFHQVTKKIIEFDPDLVLLDIVLPGTNGQTILKEIRKESNLPVIMLTSKTGDINEIMSMSYGADDYITKPYNPTLLLQMCIRDSKKRFLYFFIKIKEITYVLCYDYNTIRKMVY